MKKIIIFLMLGLSLSSCEDALQDPMEKTYTTPAEIGTGVYELYQAFFVAAAKVIDEGATDCSGVEVVGEKFKKKIIELGKKREALSDADKVICDQAAKDTAYDIYITDTPEFKKFNAFMDKMNADNYECYMQLFDILAINLYGNLDNVKQSFPDDVKLYE